MPDSEAWLIACAGLIALALLASLFTSLLRRAEVPGGRLGAAIAGGIMAGVFLGPSVLGRTAPGVVGPAFTGGLKEEKAVENLLAEHRRALNALTATGVSPAAMTEMDRTHAAELAAANEALDLAQRDHAARWSLLGALCAGVYLMAATLLAAPALPGRWRRLGGALIMMNGRPLLAGWLALAIAGAPIAALAMLALRWPWTQAAALAVVFATPGVSAMLGPTAFLVACGGLFAGFVVGGIVGWNLGFTVAVTGVFLGLLLNLGMKAGQTRRTRRLLRPAALGFVLPLLSALCMVRLDLHHLEQPTVFWVCVLAALLWSSDGRWIAARTAIQLSRSRRAPLARAWSHAASIVDAGSSVVQIIAALVLMGAGMLALEATAGAVIGACLIELTRDLRRYVATRLDGV